MPDGQVRKRRNLPARRRKPTTDVEVDEEASATSGQVRHAVESGQAPTLQSLRALQREAGNRAVRQLVGDVRLQRDLKLDDGPDPAVGHLQQQLNAAGATPRLSVNGRFDAATEFAVKAFETAQGILPPTGIVTAGLQAKLDAVAPFSSHGDKKTVVVGPGNSQQRLPGESGHPMIRQGSKGPAVTEAQERLNNSPTMSETARKARNTATETLATDGIFGARTAAAVRQFQRDKKLGADAVIGPMTWGELEKAGSASAGRVEFEWREEVEGVTNVGGRAKYQWKMAADRLLISAKIDFVPKAPNVLGKVPAWQQDVKDIWNSMKAVNKKNPAEFLKVDFEIEQAKGDFSVNVFKKLNAQGVPVRSDAANWNVLDNRKGLAPHEFGHLLGLADEYNRDEGQYLAVTGEEVEVGNPAGDKATADALATQINGAMPLVDNGTTLAGIVNGALGRSQGGFSRFVRERYAALFGADVANDIKKAFNDKNITGFTDEKTQAIEPFLYSSGSIMGTMVTAENDGATHDHPVEPRHLKPFVDIISKEKSLQSGQPEVWEPARR